MSATNNRKRILFVAEAVTLAHVARLAVLAQALDPACYEIYFACADGFDFVLNGCGFKRRLIKSISGEQFMQALARGSPVYDTLTLNSYIEEDLRVFDEIKPDLVVGDFRLSLAVSAPLRNIPYVALVNAHWSPYSSSQRFPFPEHPLSKLVGVKLASIMFGIVQPLVFFLHARPLNALRKRYGLPRLGDLKHAYTYGDYVLYADTPYLVPTANLPANHHYIGPVIWSPEISTPSWWEQRPVDRPWIYATLGSSGEVSVLPEMLEAARGLPVYLLLATAGRVNTHDVPENIWVVDYMPGLLAAQSSQLVICNGGSATVYQALSQGVPVLGIASNMDQYLTMSAVVRVGAGVLLRAGQAERASIATSIRELLRDGAYRVSAQQVAYDFEQHKASGLFRYFVQKTLEC